jgi:CelD/BcsL family acetyltransferase involved in cellulose biosynthesis
VAAQIITSREAAAGLLPDWFALWRASENATPFQSPHWLLAWWDAFAPGELRIIAAYDRDRLIGLAPLYRESWPHGPRLLPLGISLSDYLDVLAHPAFAEQALHAISTALADCDDIELVEWGELQANASALRLPAPFGWNILTGQASTCPVTSLPLDSTQLKSVLSPSRWRHLKTARNRAARRGDVDIVHADGSSAPALLAELIRLHSAAWQERGEPGVFCDPRVPAFHAAAIPRLMHEDVGRLYALRIAGSFAAAYYGFQHRERAYAYLSGYDPQFAFESPGALLLAHAMERAIEEGAREFHFLRGREAYKYEWGGKDRINVRLTLARSTQRRAYA